MRTLLAILFALLLAPLCRAQVVHTLPATPTAAGSNISYIGGASASCGNDTSCSVTYTGTTGNTFIVYCLADGQTNGATCSSVTDSSGDTFTDKVNAQTSGGGGGTYYIAEIWATTIGGGHDASPHTFTANAPSSDIIIIVEEYHGAVSFGVSTTNSDSSGTATVATVTLSGMASSSSWALACHADRHAANPTANTGNLRHANNASADDNLGAASTDNTGATSETNAVNIGAAAVFASAALEIK